MYEERSDVFHTPSRLQTEMSISSGVRCPVVGSAMMPLILTIGTRAFRTASTEAIHEGAKRLDGFLPLGCRASAMRRTRA